MKFIDSAKIYLKAGKGGDGIVSFRREAHVPLGGPFGGDGGKGGSIIFEVDTAKTTLLDLRYRKKIVAENGENGKTKKMHGADGEDQIVAVPLGTIVKNLSTGNIVADLTNPGQRAEICKGGKGGRGNFHFRTSRNPAPEYAEKGEAGEEFEAYIELKLLADVGLVGFPSVGKSTILSVVSAARPEIADYPFTTLTPKMGVVAVGDGRSFVMADLPGLIEGASQGKGLGHEFLKHIERCRVIIHVVDMSPNSGRDPVDDYRIINKELEEYKYRLLQRPQIVVANKMDEDGAEENLERFRQAYPDLEVFPVISLIGDGMQAVLYKAADLLDVTEPFPLEDENEDVGVVYGFVKEEEPFIIRNLGNGSWSIESERITRLMARTTFVDEEQIIRFGMSLKKMGVDDALRERGASENDTVYIDDYIFEMTELL
ncbi:MAG: GTPase ObgE [Erysipelotrichaceae bacterium]|nr:GTPase ObgE [Erysipelotrichaceae bacterium]